MLLSVEVTITLFIAHHHSVMATDYLTELINSKFNDGKCAAFKMKRSKCALVIAGILAPPFFKTTCEGY